MLTNLLKTLRSFSKNERLVFAAASLIFVLSGIFIVINFIDTKTVVVPVRGGSYREGIVGQPSFVNPALMNGNDPDRDLTEIIFSNVIDLADSYKVSPDGKTWDIRLKDNIKWDDNERITSDDIIFTIQTIQDPDSRSSFLPVWQGIDAERVSEREFKIVLPQPYAFFIDNLRELRPIPKHIFGSLPVSNMRLSNYNLEPVGSGPFKFDSFQKRNDGFITQYNLVRNDAYFGTKPYLDGINFRFYEDGNNLISAVNIGAVDGAGGLTSDNLSRIHVGHQTFEMEIPRYYGIFFNASANPALADKNVRMALNQAVDKNELVQKVFNGYALTVSGPMVPGMDGYAAKAYPKDGSSPDNANQILDLSGWQKGADGIRARDLGQAIDNLKPGLPRTGPTRLEFTLVVPQTKFLVDAANIVAADWAKIGVKLNLNVMNQDDINNNALRTRNYDMILFGNIFGNNPDLFSFWHSSERFYPGLNLALYQNSVTDSLIESIRKELNPAARQLDFASAQSSIINDQPAVFLFSPSYIYIARTWLGGLTSQFLSLPSYRFQNTSDWYVKTARTFR